ncbi:hypothetical protein [Cellvibrio fibrivorans]|uniref:Uncharacterized protein n=1 Tax=Cellvibrio fibrivorans TaxID=126350 RepID=A0ABU1UTY2_9GAMM|nr:hypothetical protein [Cellvibrio fibrivorans]MDR7088636.1 hypothetical protein [Cellvibrio fibrivorans]
MSLFVRFANLRGSQAIHGVDGVPTIGRVEGGKISIFKLEHVWVEAYV